MEQEKQSTNAGNTHVLEIGEDFEHARCLWNSEVYFMLQSVKEKQQNSQSAQSQVLNQTFDYVKKLNNFEDKEAFSMARELLREQENLTEFESAMLNNLNTDNVDEAKTLIPSIRDKFTDEELEQLLGRLSDYQSEQ